MNNNCPLYALQSKRQLKEKLHISNNKYIKGNFQDELNIFIDTTGKPRLIEAPSQELKDIQSKLKDYLHLCDFPDFVFSGVKKKTYIENASSHKNCKYLFKADISAFFPNISRNTVYSFFKYDLATSSDVAKILTDICTVDISIAIEDDKLVREFINNKKIRQKNHLCTGSPSSQLLSYLVNRKMFDELKAIAENNNYTFTVYVDDIFFSSKKPISKNIQNKILKVIKKYGYNISKNKVTYYKQNEYKEVTGVIITPDNRLVVTNKLKRKLVNGFSNGQYKVKSDSIRGMLIAARRIENNIFQNINKHINGSN